MQIKKKPMLLRDLSLSKRLLIGPIFSLSKQRLKM